MIFTSASGIRKRLFQKRDFDTFCIISISAESTNKSANLSPIPKKIPSQHTISRCQITAMYHSLCDTVQPADAYVLTRSFHSSFRILKIGYFFFM